MPWAANLAVHTAAKSPGPSTLNLNPNPNHRAKLTLVSQLHEGLDHCVRQSIIQSEALPTPVTTGTQAPQLVGDEAAIPEQFVAAINWLVMMVRLVSTATSLTAENMPSCASEHLAGAGLRC
jgi:hypothetical protein